MLRRFKWARYFKRQPLLGLDIGSDAIRLLALRKTAVGFVIEKIGSQPLAPGVVADGSIVRWETVKTQLQAMSAAATLSGYAVALALPRAAVIHQQIQLPAYVNETDLKSELQRRFLEYVPSIPEKELYFDYLLTDTRDEMHEILLIATHKTQLQPYWEVVKAAGLELKIVDVDLYARMRAGAYYLAQDEKKESATVALLDLQEFYSTLIIFQRGIAVFHQIWQLSGLDRRFFQELEKAWQLYAATFPELRIQRLMAVGAVSEGAALLQQIEENFSVETQQINPLQGLSAAPSLAVNSLEQDASRFLLCCGLALRVA
jgi:type IV pilus assembly protein PilM